MVPLFLVLLTVSLEMEWALQIHCHPLSMCWCNHYHQQYYHGVAVQVVSLASVVQMVKESLDVYKGERVVNAIPICPIYVYLSSTVIKIAYLMASVACLLS